MAKLKGSSLVEATVALTLLTIVLGVAWLCFEQLLTNSTTTQSLQAELLLRQRADQLVQQVDLSDQNWDTLGYRILHEWQPATATDVYWLSLRCLTPDQHVFTHRTLIDISQ